MADCSEHAGFSRAESPGAVVALEAERENHRPPQQFRVRRAMRIVAGFAALHAHAGVFEDERPALIDVALEAGLLVIERLLSPCASSLRHAATWRRKRRADCGNPSTA